MTRYYVLEAGASFEEIAAELGIHPTYARLIYSRALRKARAILEQRGITNVDQALPEMFARHDCMVE